MFPRQGNKQEENEGAAAVREVEWEKRGGGREGARGEEVEVREMERAREERETKNHEKRREKRGKQSKRAKKSATHIIITPGFLFGRGLPLSTPTYDTSSLLGGACCDGGPGEDVGSPLPPRAIGRRGELGAIE